MTGPSGPCQIGATVFGELGVRCELAPEHVVREEAASAESVRRERYRVRLSLSGAALTPARATLLARLFAEPVVVVPRTLAGGDPAWAEETAVEMVATSPVRMTEDASRRDAGTGAVAYAVEVEAESVGTFSAEALGLVVGAFERVAETEDSVSIEAVEGATLTPGPTYAITPASGDAFVIETVVPGDARTKAARTLARGPHHVTLLTREPAP